MVEQLKTQADHPFKSLVLKSCMKGKSANNASFLAAILRSPEIKLIQPAEKNLFLHQLVEDFDAQSAALLKRTK